MKPKQRKQSILKIILDLQNPKSSRSHTNILPDTIQNKVSPKIVHNRNNQQHFNKPSVLNPSHVRELIQTRS